MHEWDAYIRALLARAPRTRATRCSMRCSPSRTTAASLTEDEIAANATFLFLAGHETTTEPDRQRPATRCCAIPRSSRSCAPSPGLVENAIEELLRFDSPVQFAPRVALEHDRDRGRHARDGAADHDRARLGESRSAPLRPARRARRRARRSQAAVVRRRTALLRRCGARAARGEARVRRARRANAHDRARQPTAVSTWPRVALPRWKLAITIQR